MTAERAQALVDLYTAFGRVQTQEELNVIEQHLEEAYQQPQTIHDLFLVMSNSEDAVKRRAAIALKNMFKRGTFVGEQIGFVKEAFIALVPGITDIQTLRLLGDAALTFMEKIENLVWPEFYGWAMSLFGNALTVSTGLFIWGDIAKTIPEIALLESFERLMGCIISAMQQGDHECRVRAIQLFRFLCEKVKLELFTDFTPLPELFLRESMAVVTDRVPLEGLEKCQEEGRELFGCIYEQLFNENPLFLPFADAFLKIALDITISEAHPYLRETCQDLLCVGVQLNPDDVVDNLAIYLNATLKLAVELCTGDRSSDINFVGTFTSTVAENTEAGTDLLHLLLTFTEQAAAQGSAPGLQVAIHAFTGALKGTRDEIAEISNQMMELIGKCIEQDEFLFDCCCKFFNEASDVCPDIYASNFNQIIEVLVKHLNESMALQTLDFMMYSSNIAPDNYIGLLSGLTQLVTTTTPDRYEELLSCMTSAISSVDEVNNDVYAGMRGLLIQLLGSDPSSRAKVFECFGFLARIAPQAIQSDLEELMKVLFSSFSADDDNLNEHIALCIKNVTEVLPLAVRPFVPNLAPPFLTLLSKEIVADEEEDEEDALLDVSIRMQTAVLDAVATLITELPTEMAPFAAAAVNGVTGLLDSFNKDLQNAAARSICLMHEGLKALKFDEANTLLGCIVDTLHTASKGFKDDRSLELASRLLFALGSLLSSFASSFSQKEIVMCLELFEECFRGEMKVLCTPPKYQMLDVEVLDSLFFAIRMFVFGLGSNFEPISERFVAFLVPHLNSKKKITKAYIVHTFSIISMVCPAAAGPCGTVARDLCFQLLTRNNGMIENVLLQGMTYLVTSHNELFSQEHIVHLYQLVRGILGSRTSGNFESDMIVDTAATLWCALTMVYGAQGDDFGAVLEVVLNLLPPSDDEDDMPFIAKFLAHGLTQWADIVGPHARKIAVFVFSSSELYVNLVPGEVMKQLAAIVSAIPEEELWPLLKWNQHSYLQIQKNLARL